MKFSSLKQLASQGSTAKQINATFGICWIRRTGNGPVNNRQSSCFGCFLFLSKELFCFEVSGPVSWGLLDHAIEVCRNCLNFIRTHVQISNKRWGYSYFFWEACPECQFRIFQLNLKGISNILCRKERHVVEGKPVKTT